jgi:patatin-like phospholipase/acyl hydrolase
MPPKPDLRLVSFGKSPSYGLCELLTLRMTDGGGIRGLSQLEIMRNIMHQLNWDSGSDGSMKGILPCERFDLMGGSGTGG